MPPPLSSTAYGVTAWPPSLLKILIVKSGPLFGYAFPRFELSCLSDATSVFRSWFGVPVSSLLVTRGRNW